MTSFDNLPRDCQLEIAKRVAELPSNALITQLTLTCRDVHGFIWAVADDLYESVMSGKGIPGDIVKPEELKRTIQKTIGRHRFNIVQLWMTEFHEYKQRRYRFPRITRATWPGQMTPQIYENVVFKTHRTENYHDHVKTVFEVESCDTNARIPAYIGVSSLEFRKNKQDGRSLIRDSIRLRCSAVTYGSISQDGFLFKCVTTE